MVWCTVLHNLINEMWWSDEQFRSCEQMGKLTESTLPCFSNDHQDAIEQQRCYTGQLPGWMCVSTLYLHSWHVSLPLPNALNIKIVTKCGFDYQLRVLTSQWSCCRGWFAGGCPEKDNDHIQTLIHHLHKLNLSNFFVCDINYPPTRLSS